MSCLQSEVDVRGPSESHWGLRGSPHTGDRLGGGQFISQPKLLTPILPTCPSPRFPHCSLVCVGSGVGGSSILLRAVVSSGEKGSWQKSRTLEEDDVSQRSSCVCLPAFRLCPSFSFAQPAFFFVSFQYLKGL